jgi:hypothetical protein
MQSASFDVQGTRVAPYHRVTKRELLTQQRNLFDRVISAYVQVRGYPVVVAVDPDDDPVSRSHKWTPTLCHYLVDVELSTTDALKELPELQAAWFTLAAGEIVEPSLAEQVVSRCARLYKARGLDPGLYFRPSHRRGRAASATV